MGGYNMGRTIPNSDGISRDRNQHSFARTCLNGGRPWRLFAGLALLLGAAAGLPRHN
jgi:hypothetical protein